MSYLGTFIASQVVESNRKKRVKPFGQAGEEKGKEKERKGIKRR
jgi:hypothetical protein